MEKSKKSTYAIIAVILLIIGITVDAVVLTQQNKQIILDEEEQLMHLAQSIDINISSTLRTSQIILNSEQGRYSTRNAELKWIRTGNSEDLLGRLQSDVVDSSDYIESVAVIRKGSVALSTDGQTGYDLHSYETDDKILPCSLEDGTIKLMLVSDADEYGVQYGAIINTARFYNFLISSDITKDKWVLLMDSNSQIMIHHQQSSVLTDPIDAVTGATAGPGGIEMIINSQASESHSAGKYEYWDKDNQIEHVAYMYVMPSMLTRNGLFTVGVAGQIDNKIQVQNRAIIGYAVGTVCFAISLALFSFVIRTHRREERAHVEELELLRQKNKEMALLEQKRKELAHLDRLETIGTLTSGIAHEFNNLLTPIMAYSLLSLEKLPEDAEEMGGYLEEIYNASKRAKMVVSRLSDLSRSGAEKVYSECSINAVIDKAVESSAPASPKNVELEKDYCENSLAVINELQIHQTLLNLILNAYHAMSPDGGKLLIQTMEEDENIVIRVSDSGPGIKPEIADKIFDPFFTTKENNKGTGLGLAICRQSIEDHKGEIRLEKSELGGACFVIRIPKQILVKP